MVNVTRVWCQSRLPLDRSRSRSFRGRPPPGPSAVFHAAENGRRKRLGRRKACLGSGSAGKEGATRAGRWQGAACGPAGPRTGPVGGCGATWPCGAVRGLAVVSGLGCRLTRVSPSGALGKARGARSRRPRAHEGHEGAVCKLSRYVLNHCWSSLCLSFHVTTA